MPTYHPNSYFQSRFATNTTNSITGNDLGDFALSTSIDTNNSTYTWSRRPAVQDIDNGGFNIINNSTIETEGLVDLTSVAVLDTTSRLLIDKSGANIIDFSGNKTNGQVLLSMDRVGATATIFGGACVSGTLINQGVDVLSRINTTSNSVSSTSIALNNSVITTSQTLNGTIGTTSIALNNSVITTSQAINGSIGTTSIALNNSVITTSQAINGSIGTTSIALNNSVITTSQAINGSIGTTSIAINNRLTPIFQTNTLMSSTATINNLRSTNIVPRSTQVASPTSVGTEIVNYDIYSITALANTCTINPAVSGNNGQRVLFEVKDNGTSRQVIFQSPSVRAFGGRTLTQTTTISKIHYYGLVYSAPNSVWNFIANTTEN